MSNDYPRMLFKAPGQEEFHGGHFDTKIVGDDEERDDALAAGWHLTTPEAQAAYEQAKAEAAVALAEPVLNTAPEAAVAPDSAPPAEVHADHDSERAALKAEAAELKLAFPKNIPTDKLRELVAAAKSAAAEGEE